MIRQLLSRVLAVLLVVIVATATVSSTTPVRSRAAADVTYACTYFHVSIAIPSGWTPDTDFASKEGVCTDGYHHFASTWYYAPKRTASFALIEARGTVTARAAILIEVNDGLLVKKPTVFRTIHGAAGAVLTATFRSGNYLDRTEANYLYGAVCQRHYCMVFISRADLSAPNSYMATLRTTLQSLRFLPGAASFVPVE